MKAKSAVLLIALLALASPGALQAQSCLDETTKCISLPGGGDCASIGTWNEASKTCKLTGDLTGEAIQIAGNGVTLDGAGHTLTGKRAVASGDLQPFGVYVAQRNKVSITNLTVQQYQAGIDLRRVSGGALTGNQVRDCVRVGIGLFQSTDNVLAENSASSNGDGIVLKLSGSNTLRRNVAESNRDSGIILNAGSSENTLTGNVSRGNAGGLTLGSGSYGNTIRDNEVAGNRRMGIAFYYRSDDNIVTGNRVDGNAVGSTDGAGVLMLETSGNRFSDNSVTGNSRGIWLSYPEATAFFGGGNEIYNNDFVGNETQALITGSRSTTDVFSKQAPVGGNHWGNWTGPDDNQDGFVDASYQFSGGGDTMPWISKDGWTARPAPQSSEPKPAATTSSAASPRNLKRR
jgi:parallel beta-helix repeat protein